MTGHLIFAVVHGEFTFLNLPCLILITTTSLKGIEEICQMKAPSVGKTRFSGELTLKHFQ